MSPGQASLKKPAILALALIVLVTAAIRLPLLDIPFERDEGEYAYIAWRLGHGELPYRDWVDQKPPGVFWVYRAALSLPMEPVRAVHFMGMLWAAASACALFYLARAFLKSAWAAAAGVLFAVIFVDPMVQGTVSNTELFMLLPLLLSHRAFFFAIPKGSRQIIYSILCGVLTGIAVAFKQVAAVNWLFLVALYPFFAGTGRKVRDTYAFAGWSALGGAAVWGVISLYFLARGGWSDFIYHVFTHNLEYVSAMSWSARWEACLGTLKTLSGTQAIVWIFCFAGLVAVIANRRCKLLLYLAGWLISSVAAISASGYYFPHYFQQFLPGMALTAIIGAEWLFGLRFWANMAAPVRGAILALLLLWLPAAGLHPFLFKYTPSQAVDKMYPFNPFAVMPALGSRLAEITGPEDKVFVFGAEPELLFYAKRVSATRYIFLFPLYGPYSDALERQRQTAEEIARARPKAAFFLPNQLFSIPGSEQQFTRWSVAYLEANYRADRYLTLDKSNKLHVVSGANGQVPVVPSGQTMIGALLIRKTP